MVPEQWVFVTEGDWNGTAVRYDEDLFGRTPIARLPRHPSKVKALHARLQYLDAERQAIATAVSRTDEQLTEAMRDEHRAAAKAARASGA